MPDKQSPISPPQGTTAARAEFNRAFVENQRAIYAHLFTLLSRHGDVEEVFQSTCVVLLNKAHQFQDGTDFIAWARQIAEYEAYNYRRRRQNDQFRFSDKLVETLADQRAEMSHELTDQAVALRQCIEKLRPADERLLSLRYGTKTTTKQVAKQLGRPIGGTHKAIQRVRNSLRECIERKLAVWNREA